MSNTTSSGLFMPVIDWSDPKFAEWSLSKMDCNEAQREMFLAHDPVRVTSTCKHISRLYQVDFQFTLIFRTTVFSISQSNNKRNYAQQYHAELSCFIRMFVSALRNIGRSKFLVKMISNHCGQSKNSKSMTRCNDTV